MGKGSMGVVYRAFDRLTQQPIALKRVFIDPADVQHNSIGDDPLFALAVEFRTLASLHHPNIIPVLDYGFDANRAPYYTMMLLDGARSLLDYGRSLDDAGKVRLLNNLLQALAYLHRRNVIHHDLKPSNLLVTPDGRLWVLDFGLALTIESSKPPDNRAAGTLPYMAPEVLLGTPASVTSDLYAVGVMLFELWANRHPFLSDMPDDSPFLSLDSLLNRPADVSELPPALAPLAARLLSKTPEDRPAHADLVIAALCEAMQVPLPTESFTIRESFLQASTFVGRDAEFALLQDALSDTLVGGRAFWLVGGESGVGKSRLLDELRTRALVKGALVLRGQAVAEGGLPYQLWRDIARCLVLETTLTDFDAGVLKAIVPDIGALLGREVPDAPELPGKAGQDRLVDTLADMLKRQKRPLVLLLEDLQWATESLLLLTKLLALRDQLKSLLVIASYRDDERPQLPEALAGASVLKLPRLTGAAVEALARAMLGEAGEQPQVIELLQREAEGNAFFMVETVRALAEEAGSLSAIGTSTLPSAMLTGSIQRIIIRRLERMPEKYRPLLQRAAVAGRQLDLAVLARLAEGDSEAFLIAGAGASVLERIDGGWRFTHDKLRDGVLRALTAEERRAIHRAVALSIEAAYPRDKTYDEPLLGHWQAAGDVERELHYLLPVVQTLIRISAEYGQAEALIVRGLSLLCENDVRQAILLNRYAETSWRRAAYSAAEEYARMARSLAEQLGAQAEVADSLNNLGSIRYTQGDYATARDYHQQSLGLYRSLGDQRGVFDSLDNLGSVSRAQGDYATTRDYYQQCLSLARDIGDKRCMALSLNNLGTIMYAQGDYDTARDYYQQCLSLARDIGHKHGTASILNNLGDVLYMQGDYTTARDYYQQSLALFRDGGNKHEIANSLSSLVVLAFEQDTPQLLAYLRESLYLCLESHLLRTTTFLLVTVARWIARTSHVAEAARLAGLIEHHPATDAEIRQQYLDKLLRELKALLPVDTLAPLMAEGSTLDLEATAREWLGRLEALQL